MPLNQLRSAPTHEERLFPEEVLRAARESEWVIGTDEVGYGAWAGALVVVGVIVAGSWTPPDGLTDSKKVKKAEERERLFKLLVADPTLRFLVHTTPHDKIDELGAGVALVQAHQSLHAELRVQAPGAYHLADGSLALGSGIRSEPRADGHVPAVSAASILAKVTRDREMIAADELYPGYGFASSKGYGGNDKHVHTMALHRLGPCPIHRRSYSPVARVIVEATFDEPFTAWEVPIQET